MAIKTENILAVGSLIYADNAEKNYAFARIYDKDFKVASNTAFRNKQYIGKVKSLLDMDKGFVQIDLAKEQATLKTATWGNSTTITKGKTKVAFFKLSEINTQREIIVTMKTKYCKASTVNIRPSASNLQKPIAILSKGQPVSATGKTLAGFTEISCITLNGVAVRGWAFSLSLSDTVPTAEVTAKVVGKIKRRKPTAGKPQKPNIVIDDYPDPVVGSTVVVTGDDGQEGYPVLAKSEKEVNLGGIALSLIIVGGLVWAGKKLFGKKTSERKDLNTGK